MAKIFKVKIERFVLIFIEYVFRKKLLVCNNDNIISSSFRREYFDNEYRVFVPIKLNIFVIYVNMWILKLQDSWTFVYSCSLVVFAQSFLIVNFIFY